MVHNEERILEPGNSRGDAGRGRFKGYSVEVLIEAARDPEVWGWDEARRARAFQRIMGVVEKRRERRLLARAFAAGATVMLVAGLLLRLAGVEVLGPTRLPVALGEKAVGDRPMP